MNIYNADIDTEVLAQMELEQEAQKLIEQADPSQQDYYQRLDKKTIIRTEQELLGCISHQVPVRIVHYSYAMQILKEEEAAQRKKIAKRKARKVAKASRKKNRKR